MGLGKSILIAWVGAALYSLVVRRFFDIEASHPGNWLVALMIVIVVTIILRYRSN